MVEAESGKNQLNSVPRLPQRVDLWRAPLLAPRRRLDGLSGLLDPHELQSVEKLREPHRSRRLLARASLRVVLAGYLDQTPADVQFSYGPWGKPAVEPSPTSPGVEFNLSTSHDRCLIAVSRAGPVGVDIEAVAPVPYARQLARRFFDPAEVAILEAGSAEDPETFLRYWTAKEAWAKATGLGLSSPLAAYRIPEQFLGQRTVAVIDSEGQSWVLTQVDQAPDIVGSLALKGEIDGLRVAEMTLDSNRLSAFLDLPTC